MDDRWPNNNIYLVTSKGTVRKSRQREIDIQVFIERFDQSVDFPNYFFMED